MLSFQLCNVRIVGINLIVLIKKKWLPYVTSVENSYTRVAFGGLWVRFHLYYSPFTHIVHVCFSMLNLSTK